MSALSYPRQYRLSRGPDLERALREGKRMRTKHLEVRILASPLHYPRVGIIVPRHGHSAVERNRVKRRLRELVRCDILPFLRADAVDIVIRAGSRAYGLPFDALRSEVIPLVYSLVQRLKAV